VARAAGVSTQTVSRVVNHKGEISPETRERVLAVIARLGYRPNRVAQSLARQQTDVIGLVVPDITSSFYAELVRGVEDCAYKHDYRIFLCNIVESPERELSAIESLEDHGAAGIILAGSRLDDDTLTNVVQRNSNIVLVNRQLPNPHSSVVTNDDQLAGYLATQYLLKKGHKVICFMGGQLNSFSRQERISGYCRALSETGIPADERLLFEGLPYLSVGRELICQVMQTRPDATAVLVFNVLMAIGALQKLKEKDKNDMAIVGFDDILMASFVTPSLTTVRIKIRQMGEAAMQIMLRCLDDNTGTEDHAQHPVVFEPELIVRESA
jgi:LacI family transcriptional regulator